VEPAPVTAAAPVRVTTPVQRRKSILATVLILIGLPVLLASVEAVSYQARNRSNGTIISSGQTREYLLYVPRSYDRTRPTPLIISMHGAALWPAAQREASQWNDLADLRSFIVAYPSGEAGNGPRVWNVHPGKGLPMDVRFISDLIDTLKAAYNIDPARIYANGLSNGGGMSFVLSCTLSDRIAAVGTVVAAQTLPFSWCRDSTPVPMIAFYGTADPVIPYQGGLSWVAPMSFPRATTWAADWARRNRCGANPIDSVIAADVIRREYSGCARDATVVLYTILGGGHTWPGGKGIPEWILGRNTRSIDATREMWDFFLEHRLPTPSGRKPNSFPGLSK
jgi:polyhydroxybutyrate depolymerase